MGRYRIYTEFYEKFPTCLIVSIEQLLMISQFSRIYLYVHGKEYRVITEHYMKISEMK